MFVFLRDGAVKGGQPVQLKIGRSEAGYILNSPDQFLISSRFSFKDFPNQEKSISIYDANLTIIAKVKAASRMTGFDFSEVSKAGSDFLHQDGEIMSSEPECVAERNIHVAFLGLVKGHVQS